MKTILPPATAPDRRAPRAPAILRALDRAGVFVFLLALVIVDLLLARRFAGSNLLNVLRSVTLLGIVSMGAAFVTCSRHYVDLSIPAIMAFSGLAAISFQPWGAAASLAAGLLSGLAVGCVNGLAVGYLRVNPILWTLAASFTLRGLLQWVYGGKQVYPDAGRPAGAFFLDLSQREVLGFLPLPTLVFLAIAPLACFLLHGTRFGAGVRLTGASYEVARLSGVPVRRIVFLTFVISSFATTVAGLLLTSMNRQGTFLTGRGYDFNAVTAVVLGGVSLAGGKGSMPGALAGVLVMGFLLNLMNLAGLDSFQQMVVKGLVFIAVVAVAAGAARRAGGKDA